MIYTIKTVVGRENIVIDNLSSKVKPENINIQSFVHPQEIKGYVFVEGDIKDIEKIVQMVPHVRGIIKSPVQIKEIQKFLEPKTVEIKIERGDIVEVIGGPFKGEKGKITKYDKVKREITMELLEVAVPIPITVNVELVKVIEKSDE